MPCTVVVGGFFGDEGKGKLVAYLALTDKPAIVARGGVGPNAGHTVEYQGKIYSLRTVPSGFVYEKSRLLVGPGEVVNPPVLLQEIELTATKGRLGLDMQCAIIEDKHIEQEKQSAHLAGKIGSTKSGVGACNSDRVLRGAKVARDLTELADLVTDVPSEINETLKKKQEVLLEGTQGTFLSLYHGTYPYCTSKDTCASAICSSVGIGPTSVDEVIVVFKAFVTRVGQGPLRGELSREETIKRGWQEFGTVTRRERRAAPFDLELARRAVLLNGATQVAVTKIDRVFPEARGSRVYDQLPGEAKAFLEGIEKNIGIKVTLIGTGPSAEEIIDRRSYAS